jgi:hypothetical protein
MKKNNKSRIKNILIKTSIVFLAIFVLIAIFSIRKIPEKINYGVSFNTLYAKELNLNWKQVYDVIINELKPKKIRLAAHWDLVEPKDDEFNFAEIDYQINKATEKNIEIILAVGKRLPRWPECHIPDWAKILDKKDTEDQILEYLEKVISRYQNNKNIKIWQVENEPFLSVFAKDHCKNFSKDFLDNEIELVKKLDPTREVLITDSGELSSWARSYKRGDIFGTTLYIYAWNKYFGDFRSFVWPGFYSLRKNIWNIVYGEKESIIAELSLEPWLNRPIKDEKIETLVQKMSPEKFENILKFAKKTGFETQYLWGAEWWYYMKLNGNDWYFERGKELFK